MLKLCKTATETQVIVSTIVTLSLALSAASAAASAGAIGILKNILFFKCKESFILHFIVTILRKGEDPEVGGKGRGHLEA